MEGNETNAEIVTRLLKAWRFNREEWAQGRLCSIGWMKSRREIIKEADGFGVTTALLDASGKEE